MRTIDGIGDFLHQLDYIITTKFIPNITGGIQPTENERLLFSLPPSMGGLGIPIFAEEANNEFKNSIEMTRNLANNITNQERTYNLDQNEQRRIKNNIKACRRENHRTKADHVFENMTTTQQRLHEINSTKGASIWLSTLPLKEEGYQLDKGVFWDLIKIRYGKPLSRLPDACSCGARFDLQHALSCKKGGFVTLRHNIIRNITADLLTEICKDVRIEPSLQTITGEEMPKGSITSNEARLDVSARDFWIPYQKAFFDIRVFNPLAGRYGNMSIEKAHEINEKEKKKA